MRRSAVVLVLVFLASACSSPQSSGISPSAGARSGLSAPPTSIPVAVTLETIRAHLEALQRIGDEHGGTRAVGTTGYEASVDYAAGVLRDARYEVELRPVQVPAFEQDTPTLLERVDPSRITWIDGTDLRAMLFSARGDVRARVTTAEGGCEPTDLLGFPKGDVALLEPGPCLRRDQVLNAQDAGAAAVIFPYPDTAPGRPLRPTLLYPDGIDIPALAVTPQVRDELTTRGGAHPSVHVRVDASSSWVEAQSVIAQTSAGDPDRVVMLGAHLDSVMDGPGINDNGSGVAVTLATAQWLVSHETDATVRIAFWAGEEEGLYGSRAYVEELGPEQHDAIIAYLDLDMVASPNFARFILADEVMVSSAAEGNAMIQDLYATHFEDRGLAAEPIDTGGSGDQAPFTAAGIPIGGLFAGSEGAKSPKQAEVFGGKAGEPMDACYHQACDTIRNVSNAALRQSFAATVHVLCELASIEPA